MCGGGCRLERETHAGLRPAERGCARARQPVREQGAPIAVGRSSRSTG
jgi:hypothetical protein